MPLAFSNSTGSETTSAFSQDGRLIAACPADATVVVHPPNKPAVWSHRVSSNGATVEPLNGPYGSSVVILFDDVGEEVLALSFADGQTVWRQSSPGFSDFRAASIDGKMQVFWQEEAAWLMRLPTTGRVKLDWAQGQPDAEFTKDKNLLVLIPALLIEPGSETERGYRLVRQKHVASIFDAATGRLVRQIDLDGSRPTEANETGKTDTRPAEPRLSN